uniref:PawS-like protein 1a n=1 Tax=Coreopsis tinctoria TaxID=41554 RepID=A0A1V0JB61_CORTI|nr:PawS-like protein 1a [Coreopsis tinctoria]
MAKLALFALAFTAIVAFSAVSAYKTTIVTTIIESNEFYMPLDALDNKKSSQQCHSQVPIEQLNHCKMHLTQGILFDKMAARPFQQHLQQCCSQLKQVSEQCQCDAIQKVYDEARLQGGVVQMRQMLSKAQRLPNDCELEVQECPLASPRVC